MTSWLRRLRSAVTATPVPDGFGGTLDPDERVLTSAPIGGGGGRIVVTTLGVWLPESTAEYRRIGWHLVSKATWSGRFLTIIEADEVGTDGTAVVIADRQPRQVALPEPGNIPELVHQRVTRTVLHSERNAAGDIVVRRRVPGRDGVQVQVRRAAG